MKVSKSALPAFARLFLDGQGYKGRKLFIERRKSIAIPDAGLWAGEPLETFFALTAGTWRLCGRGETIDLPSDVCVARHAYSCGHDCGWIFYVAPQSDMGAGTVEEIASGARS